VAIYRETPHRAWPSEGFTTARSAIRASVEGLACTAVSAPEHTSLITSIIDRFTTLCNIWNAERISSLLGSYPKYILIVGIPAAGKALLGIWRSPEAASRNIVLSLSYIYAIDEENDIEEEFETDQLLQYQALSAGGDNCSFGSSSFDLQGTSVTMYANDRTTLTSSRHYGQQCCRA
jgi:hypothetical protein